MNNTGFENPMKKVKKHRDIKFVTERRRKYLMKEPNFHSIILLTENLLAIGIRKKQRYLWLNLTIY